MPAFSKKTMEYLRKPKNVGVIPDANAVGDAGNPHTSNYIKMWIKLNGKTIDKITFKAYGCVPAIAAASATTEMAMGKKISEAKKITETDVLTALDGLPPERRFCAKLAVDALKNTISNL